MLADTGHKLFTALFNGLVEDRFKEARSIVEATGDIDQGLRLRLWIEPDELQLWPWELLCDDERDEFLVQSGRTLITRYLSVPTGPATLKVTPPLRILLAAAAPVDQEFLDVEAEIDEVRAMLRPLEEENHVQVEPLPHAQMRTLRDTLRRWKPHVLHFVGHGSLHGGVGALVLEKANRRSHLLTGSTLGPTLRRNGVRLAVLNACLTARGATDEAELLKTQRRAVLGVGPALVNAGLGAVVAMQFRISESSARLFAQDLYANLAELAPVDHAVSLAREALLWEVGEGSRDWATPVLFLRAPDGVIFEA
jgi:hypothetical protein